ncbi:MAG TPA: barstar family protein [Kofleriaceae bacterium]
MELEQGLQRTSKLDVEATRRQAEDAGYATIVLPGAGIVDRGSFFDAVRATFPLDPRLLGSESWDALSDSLFEGLHTHAAQRIAILWPRTSTMASSAASDLDIALQVLADVATTLADPQATRGNPKQVAVIVE